MTLVEAALDVVVVVVRAEVIQRLQSHVDDGQFGMDRRPPMDWRQTAVPDRRRLQPKRTWHICTAPTDGLDGSRPRPSLAAGPLVDATL